MTVDSSVPARPTAGQAPKSHPWGAYLRRRSIRFVISAFILVLASFLIIHAVPGDPVRAALGLKASPALVAAERAELGLDQPIWKQLVDYFRGLLTGDLGTSMISDLPVSQTLARLLPATIKLVAAAFVTAVILSLPIGMLIGVLTREGRRPKANLLFSALTGLFGVIPDFLLGVGLVFLFAVTFQIFPVAGLSGVSSYVLPVLALAIGPAALLARIVRVETQRVLGEEYMRIARAKRLPGRLLYLRHALPNMLTAALTIGGLILSSLLAGTVIVETIFAWPGVGSLLVSSVLAKDYPTVQALALVFGGAALLINLIVDIAIVAIDHRSLVREG